MLPERALLQLWHAVRKSDRQVPFSLELAICREWSSRPFDFGSPLGPEVPTDEDGGVVQVFARGWISWHPDRGVESGP